MQLRSYISLVACGALSVGLVACSKIDVPGAGGADTSYEIVTVERPESVAEYHKLYKATYKMCAYAREVQKLPPPPPMLQPPADFISQRTTHTSDGKTYLVKSEYFTYKVRSEGPDFSCATYREDTSDTQLIMNGKSYNAGVDEHGKRTSVPPEEFDLPRDPPDTVFTVPKTIKGFALKCMPMLPNTEKLITELCTADLKPGVPYNNSGRPITVYSRVTIVDQLQSVIVTEPVSIKWGQKIDQAVFDAAAR